MIKNSPRILSITIYINKWTVNVSCLINLAHYRKKRCEHFFYTPHNLVSSVLSFFFLNNAFQFRHLQLCQQPNKRSPNNAYIYLLSWVTDITNQSQTCHGKGNGNYNYLEHLQAILSDRILWLPYYGLRALFPHLPKVTLMGQIAQ